jgi:hypothetical protein
MVLDNLFQPLKKVDPKIKINKKLILFIFVNYFSLLNNNQLFIYLSKTKLFILLKQ